MNKLVPFEVDAFYCAAFVEICWRNCRNVVIGEFEIFQGATDMADVWGTGKLAAVAFECPELP